MLGPFRVRHDVCVTVRFEFGPGVDQNNSWGAKIMAAVQQSADEIIAALKTSSDSENVALDAAVQRAVDTATKNAATIADLNQQIADLKASGGLSQAQLDALAAIQTTVAGMQPKTDAIDPNTAAVLPAT